MSAERHSVAAEAELVTDPEERARLEAKNGLLQFDLVESLIDNGLDLERPFKLRLSMILALQRQAIIGLSSYAGNFRPSSVDIEGSRHEPVDAFLVPELVEEMCDYVNENWESSTPIHLAAYSMWRLNWIHPFTDGNGRTSRAVSHLVLCVRLGLKLPFESSVPEQITNNRDPYYAALEKADLAFDNGKVDVSDMEVLLGDMLAKQLLNVYHRASAT